MNACPDCGTQHNGKYKLCDDCRRLNREYRLERYNAGLCKLCDDFREQDRVCCKACLEDQCRRVTKLAQRREAEGTCKLCNDSPKPNRKYCVKHLKRYADASKKQRIKKQQQNQQAKTIKQEKAA